MPREYVYGPAAPTTVHALEPKTSDEEPVLGENIPFQTVASVGWSRLESGGGVQLGTVVNGHEHSFDPQFGIYMDLDRDAINALIRLLRRARDQAYGKDE